MTKSVCAAFRGHVSSHHVKEIKIYRNKCTMSNVGLIAHILWIRNHCLRAALLSKDLKWCVRYESDVTTLQNKCIKSMHILTVQKCKVGTHTSNELSLKYILFFI